MAVVCTKHTFYRYSGLSTDIKPTAGVEESSTFDELDTGRQFEFRGGAWTETIASLLRAPAVRMETVGDITYIGKAAAGARENQAVWQLFIFDETSYFTVKWANGKTAFVNRWDQRASLTYI